jgi:hypothetical protein
MFSEGLNPKSIDTGLGLSINSQLTSSDQGYDATDEMKRMKKSVTFKRFSSFGNNFQQFDSTH